MISAGVEGRLPYMTYPEPWRGPTKQPELFLRPAPKPLNPTRYCDSLHQTDAPSLFLHYSRYNGVNVSSPNGTRLAPPPPPPPQPQQPSRPISKYSSPPTISAPVNLAQTKVVTSEDIPYGSYAHLYPHASQLPPFPYSLYPPQPYVMRPNYPPTPLSPLEPFSPTTPTASSTATFLSPPTTFSPPSSVKPGQSILRDTKRTPPHQTQNIQSQQQQQPQHVAFKVPSGKEGSLKHRILTRPEDALRVNVSNVGPLDLQKPLERKRLAAATVSPPRSPKKPPLNNNTVPASFAKGQLIQLVNGDLKKIEDMRTEDFVNSAEMSPELRMAESTVVKIEEFPNAGTSTITLSYNKRRSQVELESSVEHPYYVIGEGWASCNPDRTEQFFGLNVHRLQVGDVLISVMPREPAPPPPCPNPTNHHRISSTIMTTATTTAMTVRQVPAVANQTNNNNSSQQKEPINLNLHSTGYPQYQVRCVSPETLAARKRRWSAPDKIHDDEDEVVSARRHRPE